MVLAKALDIFAKETSVWILLVVSLPWYICKRGTKREMRFSSILFLVLWLKRIKVCSLVNIGSTKSGIIMTAVADMGRIIKTANLSDMGRLTKLVVFANAVEDNPFMAGAFHGVGEADVIINVGVSGPGVVKRALEKVRGESFDVVAETVKKTAFKITRIGQLVGQMASERLGVEFGIVDLSFGTDTCCWRLCSTCP